MPGTRGSAGAPGARGPPGDAGRAGEAGLVGARVSIIPLPIDYYLERYFDSQGVCRSIIVLYCLEFEFKWPLGYS